MKTEILPNKMPDGYGPTGLPIDKSAPNVRSGIRIGLNLTIMIDEQVAQNAIYPYVIIWNTQTGDRTKVYLEPDMKPTAQQGILISGKFVVPIPGPKDSLSGHWFKSN